MDCSQTLLMLVPRRGSVGGRRPPPSPARRRRPFFQTQGPSVLAATRPSVRGELWSVDNRPGWRGDAKIGDSLEPPYEPVILFVSSSETSGGTASARDGASQRQ